ncbi:ATG2 [Sanghuangporus weigelae]
MSFSWLPFTFNFSFPDLAPPLTIQRRFISFILKRSLGHLLKPGQLDVNQIDAQIGSGFVEVKDLELDCNAINSLLGSQPIQLDSGTIASVTARIPWPNPFSSTVGLSLSGLKLHLRLAEGVDVSQDSVHADELAESVASVAESFIHDELTAKEEAQLRQSIHLEQNIIDEIPGSMSSFLSQDEELTQKRINDPEGVSIFARLFESLLARFDFDASDSQASLAHEEFTIALSIGRMHYFTSSNQIQTGDSDQKDPVAGEKRSVEVSGVRMTMNEGSNSAAHTMDVQQGVRTEASHEGSDSGLDYDTHAMMSQSLAFLPPRSGEEPAGKLSLLLDTESASPESSIYQSAISAPISISIPSTGPAGADPPVETRRTEKTILSISEPIAFQLTTPPVIASQTGSNPGRSPPYSSKEDERGVPTENMKLDVSLGIIAILLDARCIRGLLTMTDAFPSAVPRQFHKTPKRSIEPEMTVLERMDVSVQLKGLIALVLGEAVDETQDDSYLAQFYERPLIPPSLSSGYLRIHVDLVKLDLENETFPESNMATTPIFRSPPSTASQLRASAAHKGIITYTVSDFSVLVFHPFLSSDGTNSSERRRSCSPFLITDRHLDHSYHFPTARLGRADRHAHPYSEDEKSASLPSIAVTEWYSEHVRPHGTSLRQWKTKISPALHQRRASGSLGAGLVSKIGIPSSPTRIMKSPLTIDVLSLKTKETFAVSVQLYLGRNASITSVNVKTTALHMFMDLELGSSISRFIESALPDYNAFTPNGPSPTSVSSQDQETDSEDDRPLSLHNISEERRRLEKLVLEDLDLSMDYLHSGEATPRRRASPTRLKPKVRKMFWSVTVFLLIPSNFRRQKAKSKSAIHFDVSVPLLRLEIRVPPPQSRQPRSGLLLLDLHTAHFSRTTSPSPPESRVPRFATSREGNDGLEDWFNTGFRSQPVSLEMHRVIIAYAALGQSSAKTVLSLGPISDSESEGIRSDDKHSRLLPLIFFRESETSGATTPQTKSNALVARIPSLHAVVNKGSLDGLQLWVDDLTQCIERLMSGARSGASTHAQVSRTSSLIGSRYFISRTGSGSTESEIAGGAPSGAAKSELVIKVCLTEAFIRFVVPASESVASGINRFLDVCASDLDALVEFKPEGKDETVISLNVLDVNIKEISAGKTHDVVATKSLGISDSKRPSVLRIRFRSVVLPGTAAKESRVRMVLNGLTFDLWSDVTWIQDLTSFIKSPPGAFESVIPSERTQISLNLLECACRITPPSRPSVLVLSFGDVTISTDLASNSQETALGITVADLSILLNDDSKASVDSPIFGRQTGAEHWTKQGFALLVTIQDLLLRLEHKAMAIPSNTQINLNGMRLDVHLCADSISGIVGFISDLKSIIPETTDSSSTQPTLPRRPTHVTDPRSSTLLRSLDEHAFRRQPVIGPLPDMVDDDLPKNPEYLDASFGAAAGLRPLDDEDVEDGFYPEGNDDISQSSGNIIARHGGETIKMLHSPIEVVENYFDTLTPSSIDLASEHGEAAVKVRAQDCEVHLLLYDGYDWERTRRTIREEVKRVRRRLAKIRQLLASGQTYDPNVEEVNSRLFDSVYVGLEPEAEDLDGNALMAAIDDELAVDTSDMASESSWQSFQPEKKATTGVPRQSLRVNRLDRSQAPSIEFSIRGMAIDFDQYLPGASLASRFLSTIRDLEILDHIKTSTWSTFLTELRSDSRGNIRETDSNMVRVELQILQPFQGHHEQEARLKAKILPLRLHVDQDALDFLKKFFSFKDGDAEPSPPPDNEIFFQHVEIFPIDIKLDYKPRRVDYKALKEGRTIELMNFFHFDGSEMTLRHLTLTGVTGWARMFDLLNDLWTPDVKANQLVDVISGVSPIRSAVNVGSGIADLVLLPIAQYKKDGRIIRGLQKGATAFMKSTAMEAIRLGARLATGTQVVLEQTENVLGAQFSGPVTAEALQTPGVSDMTGVQSGESSASAEELYSRYAEQPTNVREGVQSAYRSLSENVKYAGQTILAVPMEVYERSGTEGPARAVIRAVPIAVLKPMIGASEAVSKTLLGLHNTLDPQAQIESETKYKHR